MVSLKTEQEIAKITKASQILAEVKKIIFEAIQPGVSLKELDSIAFQETTKRGGKPAFLGYQGFPATICASLNEELIHGIPDDRILRNGDLLSVDMGVIFENYYADSAFTKSIGITTPENEKLITVAKEAFWAGVNAIKPGARLGDVGAAIFKVIQAHGCYTPKEFSGHGIGKALHEEPYVENYGQVGKGLLLRDNMVICIEPMILQGSAKIFIKPDRWTVVSQSKHKAAHYEQTLVIKNGYAIVLTDNEGI
ncbi:type I methionyl aminopeptidase [Candidatus Mycoplasma pogonae]